MVEQKKMTIAELEALLNSETDVTLRILSNGEIVQEDGSPSERPTAHNARKSRGTILMTTPEAAMTREQVLEEALRPFAKASDHVEKCQDCRPLWAALDTSWSQRREIPLTVGDLRRARAALASTRQEPAPAADAEEVALFLPLDVAQEIALACVNELMQIGPQICLFPRSHSEAIIARHVAEALRRYAGDGVTALFQISPLRGTSFGWWADVDKDAYDRAQAEHYKRRIVYVPAEAAARASGEKGGADV